MIKNTLIYTIGGLLPKFIGFLLLPIYTRFLTPADYGIINGINALVAVISIFYLVSMRTAVTRSYIDFSNEKNQREYIFSVSFFLIFYSIILSIVFVIIKPFFVNVFFNNIPPEPYFWDLVLLCFLSIFPIIPQSILRIQEKAIQFVAFNLLETLLTVIFTIYFVVIEQQGAVGSINALLISRIIVGVLYVIFLMKFLRFRFYAVKKEYILGALAISLPLIPHFLAGWINTLSDRIIIERFTDLDSLGIYSLGAQFNMIVLLLANSFNQAYSPRYFKMMKDNKVNQKFIDKLMIVVLSIFVFIGLLVFILTPLIIRYFADTSYAKDYTFVGYLIGGTLFQVCYMIAVSTLIYFKKTSYMVTTTTVSAIINLLINILLVPKIGIVGASLASLISLFIQFLLVLRLSNKFTKDIYKLKVSYVFSILSCYFIPIIIYSFFNNIFINIGIFLIVLICLALLIYRNINLKSGKKFGGSDPIC